MESKVVVITGASRGIGAALAQELGRKGHRLVLAARIASLVEHPVSELYTRQDQKERVGAYFADVERLEQSLAARQPAAR